MTRKTIRTNCSFNSTVLLMSISIPGLGINCSCPSSSEFRDVHTDIFLWKYQEIFSSRILHSVDASDSWRKQTYPEHYIEKQKILEKKSIWFINQSARGSIFQFANTKGWETLTKNLLAVSTQPLYQASGGGKSTPSTIRSDTAGHRILAPPITLFPS